MHIEIIDLTIVYTNSKVLEGQSPLNSEKLIHIVLSKRGALLRKKKKITNDENAKVTTPMNLMILSVKSY